MPMVKLNSSQPIAFSKNALLQKRYETECNHLTHDYKTAQRKRVSVAEQCVVSAYGLLIEAEQHEQEKIERGDIVFDSATGKYTNPLAHGKAKRRWQTAVHKVRPLTAAGHGATAPRTMMDKRRPSSATASLGKQSISVLSMGDDDLEDVEEEDVFMDHTKASTTLAAVVVNAQSAFTQSSSVAEHRYGQVASNTRRTSRNLHVTIAQNSETVQSPGNALRLQLNSTPLRPTDRGATSAQVKDSSKDRAAKSRSPVFDIKDSNDERPCRPRTAADYRRRCNDDTMTTYWNKRVTKLLNRWNLEDTQDPYVTNHIIDYSDDIAPPQVPQSPLLEIPTRLNKPETEAALKTKKFIQTYGSNFRSLLRPNSAPPVPESKIRRRSVKVTLQEMSSIKADLSRRRKQTNSILHKSRRIRSHIQSLADWKMKDK